MKPFKSAIFLVSFFIINLFAGVIGAYLGLNLFSESDSTPKTVETQIVEDELAIVNVVDDTENAVVSIIGSKDLPVFEEYLYNPFQDQGLGFNFGIPRREQVGTEEQQISAGSGFIVSKEGLIITNRHVISDEEASYTVVMNNGDVLDTKVIGRDTLYDLAVLQIESKNLDYLELGDSDKIQVGQRVISIGNALGQFSNTVSAGIISGLGRSVVASSGFGESETLEDVLQTDASINPGNSGGPLIDYSGKVIGVNVAMAQNAENIGFAIPINAAKNVLDSIEKYGKIVRPYLGIRYIPINEAIQKNNDLPYGYGVLVLRGETEEDLAVIPGSPADKAGIVENDIIFEVNGVKLDEDHSLQREIQKHPVGTKIQLKIYSKGQEKEVTVMLEANPL